ncbi:MAG: hypothetical protein LBL39_01905 [Planctomycetaceae bacterium]|nr:hypothetical protein [Planctomycetaceae bacterium]
MKEKFNLLSLVFGFGAFGKIDMNLPVDRILSVFGFVRCLLLRVVLFFPVLAVVIVTSSQVLGEHDKTNTEYKNTQDIWMITTETASWTRATDSEFEKIVYWHLVSTGSRKVWERSDAATFLATQNPSVPILVFSPGYTSKKSDTVEIGQKILGLCDSGKPIRMVFWHWPAEKVTSCLLSDIRSKIPVAEANAVYMSMLLKRLKPDSKVCVLGFSFGTRLLGDAVENVGDLKPAGMKINLIYGGAASDRDWLAKGNRNGNVPQVAHKILVFYNPEDFRLKFYPFLYTNGKEPAPLGRDGAPMKRIDSEFRDKIEMVNLAPHIGFRHKTVILIGTKQFKDRINEYFFFE